MNAKRKIKSKNIKWSLSSKREQALSSRVREKIKKFPSHNSWKEQKKISLYHQRSFILKIFLRSIFPLFILRYESLYFKNTHSYSLKSLTMEILFPIKSLLKYSLSVIIFNFEILSVILFTSSTERIVYRQVHTSSGKGKPFFFFKFSQNYRMWYFLE